MKGDSMWRALAAVLLVLSSGAILTAQTSFRGGISGIASDPTGAVIPGAEVKATNEATGLNYATTSSTAGEFTFADLPIGNYTIVVSQSGFSTVTTNGVRVAAGSVYNLPVKLSVAQVATNVVVEADAVALETSTTTLSTA